MRDNKQNDRHKSPKETIRAYCVYCNGGRAKQVEMCDANGKDTTFHVCPFHLYRMGKGRPSVKIIRQFCIQCMGGSTDFVRECETRDCSCYPYRMGKNPARIGKGYFADQTGKKKAKKHRLNGAFAVQDQRAAVEMAVVPPHPVIRDQMT